MKSVSPHHPHISQRSLDYRYSEKSLAQVCCGTAQDPWRIRSPKQILKGCDSQKIGMDSFGGAYYMLTQSILRKGGT